MTHLLYQLLYGQNTFMYKFHNAEKERIAGSAYQIQPSKLLPLFLSTNEDMVIPMTCAIVCQSPATYHGRSLS